MTSSGTLRENRHNADKPGSSENGCVTLVTASINYRLALVFLIEDGGDLGERVIGEASGHLRHLPDSQPCPDAPLCRC